LVAPCGERALQIAAGVPKPDLILLDVVMPCMDGYGHIPEVYCIPSQINPVLPNFLINAAQAIPEKVRSLSAPDR